MLFDANMQELTIGNVGAMLSHILSLRRFLPRARRRISPLSSPRARQELMPEPSG